MTKHISESDRFGIKINNRLLRRLQKHISASNYSLNQDLSQQDWINKAITEKLQNEKENPEVNKNMLKQVTIRIDNALKKKLEKTVARLKANNNRSKSYSKKSWILNAIEEKLEREENS
ncbi:MAG: hypothetical protein K1000chlam3_00458 [Chlamydiae bacterium]|nr:hypothetical protein [Chlamydiota bacterium]